MLFKTPYSELKVVSGAELADFLAANGNSHTAAHRIDRNMTYKTYGIADAEPYEKKKKFMADMKAPEGCRSAFTVLNDVFFQIFFRPEKLDNEKLVPYVVKDFTEKAQREAAREARITEKEQKKEERRRAVEAKEFEAAERKKYGDARVLESKGKVTEALKANPGMNAKETAEKAGVSYATATKILAKMLDNEAVTVDKRRYTLVQENKK